MIGATPHHIGCAVQRMDDGVSIYAGTLGLRRKTRAFDVASQQVRVRFIELSNQFYLELVSPLDDNTRLGRYIKAGFYHLCFLVDDLNEARRKLEADRFVALPVFDSEAFAGNRCQFFLSPQDHLIELAQISASDFARHFSANLEAA